MLTVKVDLAALGRNVATIKRRVKTGLCAVVKANAYGHGASAVAGYLLPMVDCFGVATQTEAEALVCAGITKPIIILGADYDAGASFSSNVIPSVGSLEAIKALTGSAKKVEIAVNTGMNRLGARPGEVNRLVLAAKERGLGVHGVYTHFYDGEDMYACKEQFDEFLSAALPLRREVKLFHCCASNCLILPKSYHLGMVRAGLAMYGYGAEGLAPVASVYTQIVHLGEVRRGEHISYGDFTAPKDMTVATIRAGYGDGLRRVKGLTVSVNGKLCGIIGAICMDMCMVDVTNVDCKVGDRVFILGNEAKMENLCKIYNTISHEVLTFFNDRARRKYVNG